MVSDRLRRICAVARWLCLAGVVLVPLGAVWGLVQAGTGPLWGLVFLLGPLVLAAGLFHLARVFGDYADGRVFAETTAKALLRFAQALMALALLGPVTGAARSVFDSRLNPPGERELSLAISTDTVGLFLLAALLLTVAAVLRDAARLAEDQRMIV